MLMHVLLLIKETRNCFQNDLVSYILTRSDENSIQHKKGSTCKISGRDKGTQSFNTATALSSYYFTGLHISSIK